MAPGRPLTSLGPTSSFARVEGGLRGYSIDVQCALSVHEENGVTTNVFRVTSLVEYGAFGDADYVARRLQADMAVET